MKTPFKECSDCLATNFCRVYAGTSSPTRPVTYCHGRDDLYSALRLSEIPKRYYIANLYNYIIDDFNRESFEYVKPLLQDIRRFVEDGKSLFICAEENGTGKTYHGCMFLNHYIYKTCNSYAFNYEDPVALFISYAELVDQLRTNWGEMGKRMDTIKKVPLLLLDDVGSGTLTDYAREQTFLILDYRCNHCLSTIYTSNFTPKQLRPDKMLGPRNVSRMMADGGGIILRGKDRRRGGM